MVIDTYCYVFTFKNTGLKSDKQYNCLFLQEKSTQTIARRNRRTAGLTSRLSAAGGWDMRPGIILRLRGLHGYIPEYAERRVKGISLSECSMERLVFFDRHVCRNTVELKKSPGDFL
jgi:hypothetical protein